MINRRNAFIGWLVLQVVKRKLRKQGARGGSALRRVGRLGAGAALAGGLAVGARRFLRGGGSGGTGAA